MLVQSCKGMPRSPHVAVSEHVLTLDSNAASWLPAEPSPARAADMRVSSPCGVRCLISHKLARVTFTRKETDGPTSWLSELRVRN